MGPDVEDFVRAVQSWSPNHVGARSDAVSLLSRAEALLEAGCLDVDPAVWHAYLDDTRHPEFLMTLPDDACRERWAATTFAAIRQSGFTLQKLFEQRVRRHANRSLFREGSTRVTWSYEQAWRRVQAIAAVVLSIDSGPPRVAILSDNCIDGACVDLACLAFDLFVAPLDVQLDAAALTWIFDRLAISVAVAGNSRQAAVLEQIRSRVERRFVIVHLQSSGFRAADDVLLAEAISHIGRGEIQRRLEHRARFGLDEPSTALFTSGSTGQPKGVVFTPYNLLTKRFARGAALPAVGGAEVWLCYLPLFHTFGRYLELMGSLYWGGTYVFAGNPSAEHLLGLLGRVRPTALISIPLRWAQIHERCEERLDPTMAEEVRRQHVHAVVGDRLRWGLSAAGHLDPRVFRFFNEHGIALSSGFGMTEATGGITMTPPGRYVEGTVGLPLPGAELRLTEVGELEVRAPYVARYLDEDDQNPSAADGWLSTGDVFQVRDDGYYAIVDRVKDIYKNAKGKTIAPRRVERLFDDVPGIRRVFLVGDHREYNTLLVVLEQSDPVLSAFSSAEARNEYLNQIVTAANRQLAPYERIVNYTVIERDFELDRGELTAKGSYRRKTIEEHFSSVIDELYRSRVAEVACNGLRVLIPRWLYRDQGWLEDDIVVTEWGLGVQRDRRNLTVRLVSNGRARVGDLEYAIGPRGVVDLGLFARQPLLWAGNRQLAAFCPCKDGWSVGLGSVSPRVIRTDDPSRDSARDDDAGWSGNERLARLHTLTADALFADDSAALSAVAELGGLLSRADDHVASLIRRRLEALAWHPDLRVRCLAYRTLLLDAPVSETSEVMPSFIESGLPFLDEESIDLIARSHLERERLEALRKRLYRYRTELIWPASSQVRASFLAIFELLGRFTRHHPEYFPEVRLELSAWALHDADPDVASEARDQLSDLSEWWEEKTRRTTSDADAWRAKIQYHEALAAADVERLDHLLRMTPFLGRSIAMAFEDAAPDPSDLPDEGVWVTRLPTVHQRPVFRVSVSTSVGKHYDLLVMLADDLAQDRVLETLRWIMAISAYPFGPPVVPRVGWYDPELCALSLAYIQDLTAFERIREFASLLVPGVAMPGAADWSKLFVRSMAAFFTAWRNSGSRIVPGLATPSNVAVLEPDFREAALILSLDEWRPYTGPLSLVRPLVYNFYRQTSSHQPWCRHYLDPRWIFEACIEAIGEARTREFLAQLREELRKEPVRVVGVLLLEALERFLESIDREYLAPLPLRSAIERYREWARLVPHATPHARQQFVDELRVVYGLERYPELASYHLYRATYFAAASADVHAAFDRLLSEMFAHPEQRAVTMVELSELQEAIDDPEDRAAFVRMAFPHGSPERLELLTVGSTTKQVVVQSWVQDRDGRTYTVREPVDPSEIGRLYRWYAETGLPKTIAGNNQFLVLLNEIDEVIGGLIFEPERSSIVNLRGIIVRRELKGRGLNSMLLEEFCRRMEDQGVEVIRTFFFARRFYARHGFHVDPRWGGLVREVGVLGNRGGAGTKEGDWQR